MNFFSPPSLTIKDVAELVLPLTVTNFGDAAHELSKAKRTDTLSSSQVTKVLESLEKIALNDAAPDRSAAFYTIALLEMDRKDPKQGLAAKFFLSVRDSVTHISMAIALVNTKDPRAFAFLETGLVSDHVSARLACVEQYAYLAKRLMERGDLLAQTRAQNTLFTCAREDKSSEVQLRAALGLADLKDSRAGILLSLHLYSKSPQHRTEVAFALGALRSEGAVEAIELRLIVEKDSAVKEALLRAQAACKGEKVADHVTEFSRRKK